MLDYNVHQLSRFSLLAFCMVMWDKYKPAPHHRLIASYLERVASGEIKRLVITMPPRHGKSMLASEFFPAWYLGRYPKNKIITATYGSSLTVKIGRKVRNMINSEEYKKIFPEGGLSKDSKSASAFDTIQGGYYFGTSVTGAATGMGANLFLIDDPFKNMQEAMSSTIRERVLEFYLSVALTRLENGSIVIIHTRWHEDDLIGHVLKTNNDFAVLNLPAINENGEALWEDFFGIDKLLKIKEELDSRTWSALYQQSPIPDDGGVFKMDWFKNYEQTLDYKQIIQSWDTASKTEQINDPSACCTLGVSDNYFDVLNMFTKRLEYPDLKREIVRHAEMFNPNVILIEDCASGQALIQDFRRETRLPIIPIRPTKSKEIRAMSITGICESGKVRLPTKSDWLHDFKHEISFFPNGKHDDQVDAFVQALNYTKDNVRKAPARAGQRIF